MEFKALIQAGQWWETSGKALWMQSIEGIEGGKNQWLLSLQILRSHGEKKGKE